MRVSPHTRCAGAPLPLDQLWRRRSKPSVWLRTVSELALTFAPSPRNTSSSLRFRHRLFVLGYICVECMSSRVYFAHCMYCVVVVCMGGSAAVAQISERPRSIAYPVCSTFINSLLSRAASFALSPLSRCSVSNEFSIQLGL